MAQPQTEFSVTMSPSAPPSINSTSNNSTRWIRWGPPAFLFVATAFVVLWPNSRLAVLWDVSYVLENAYRISAGDVPYRDFPFPYPPLTFLIQAGIIKLTGRVYWHTIVYSALMGGIGSVLTWQILRNVLRPLIGQAHLLAFVLALPAV